MSGIVGVHFQDSVNPYYSQTQTDDLFKFNVVVYGEIQRIFKTQIEAVQNDGFVKTVH